MNTYHVTYYYLASGMDGIADEQDFGYFSAENEYQAIAKAAADQYPLLNWEYEWLKSCLTAHLVQ